MRTDSLYERTGLLYDLVRRHLPAYVNPRGIVDVKTLSAALDLSHETVYRALRGNTPRGLPEGHLSPQVAVRLLDFSRTAPDAKPIFVEDLFPFIIPHFERYTRAGADTPEAPDIDSLLL